MTKLDKRGGWTHKQIENRMSLCTVCLLNLWTENYHPFVWNSVRNSLIFFWRFTGTYWKKFTQDLLQPVTSICPEQFSNNNRKWLRPLKHQHWFVFHNIVQSKPMKNEPDPLAVYRHPNVNISACVRSKCSKCEIRFLSRKVFWFQFWRVLWVEIFWADRVPSAIFLHT